MDMLWFNFILEIFFSFVSNSLSCYYHTLPYPKTKEKKILTLLFVGGSRQRKIVIPPTFIVGK